MGQTNTQLETFDEKSSRHLIHIDKKEALHNGSAGMSSHFTQFKFDQV